MKRLTEEDFDLLMMGGVIELGNTRLPYKPFTLEELANLKNVLKPIFDDAGININNFKERVSDIGTILIDKMPSVIADAIDLSLKDFKKLPAMNQLDIAHKVISVNVESYRGMEKNLKASMEAIPIILQGVSLMLSKPLSPTGTPGETSEVTPSEKSESSSVPAAT